MVTSNTVQSSSLTCRDLVAKMSTQVVGVGVTCLDGFAEVDLVGVGVLQAVAVLGAPLAELRRALAQLVQPLLRGLHSSTSQLNSSRVCTQKHPTHHKRPLTPP